MKSSTFNLLLIIFSLMVIVIGCKLSRAAVLMPNTPLKIEKEIHHCSKIEQIFKIKTFNNKDALYVICRKGSSFSFDIATYIIPLDDNTFYNQYIQKQ